MFYHSTLVDVQPKFIAHTSVEQRFSATANKTEVETTQIQDVIDMVPASWLTQESRSAPQLTSMNLQEHNELTESCSDSYTSTCTTTTTTSEEYQRMYNAQTSLLQSQSQSFYDHSSIDLNSSNCDYEVVSIQQQRGSFSSGSTDLMGFSGRRSAQECSDAICSTINTSQLVNYIKGSAFDGVDYSLPSLPKQPKKVGFSPNITKVETDELINSGSQPSSIAEDQNQSESIVQESHDTHESQELQELHELQLSQAAQEPQPQLKPPPFDRKSVTPSPNIIYNATPKEWKSLMVQALTTASDKPFAISDLPDTAVDNSTYESFVETSTTTTTATVDKQTLEVEQKVEEVQSVFIEKTDDEQANVKVEEPPKRGFLSTLFTGTDSSAPMEWFKPIYENVPLPEESAPYFPPNIPLLPIERHEPLRTKSPFVEALTVAPLRPFTPFENDVISQIEGLPRAPDVTLVDALTTAPSEPITKLNPDLPDETDAERIVRLEKEKQEKEAAEVRALISKTIDTELSKKCTTFAPLKGFRKVDPFKPLASYNQSPHCQSRSSSVCTENIDKTKQTIESVDHTQTNTTNKACHSQTKDSNRSMKFVKTNNFPPPPGTPVKSYVQSGLQSPKTIPKYQRQWFNLASQSPIRTPEPPELKENVPLAFCDVPHEKTESVSKPIAITISATTASSSSATATESARTESTVVVDVQKTTAVESSFSSECASTVTTVVPTLSDHRTAPITITFQTLDPKDIVEPVRSTTPSLINKPPPLVPYYQQNLVSEYCGAPTSYTFDPSNARSPSPRPDAVKPNAHGPPASVLKIQAPRITTPDSLELSTSIGVPSIVTGQSGAQLLAASRQGYSTASQSFTAQPEVFHREQKGGLSIETHSTGAELNEAKKSDVQSSSTYQVGNVQVQQNRRVIEEFEHTQKSSTTEIHTSSGGGVSELQQKIGSGAIANEYQSELTYGKGFVARQARRLSETSQSSSKNVVASYRFPQITTDTTESSFPIGSKIVEPPTPTPSASEPVVKVTKPIAQKTSFPLPQLPKTTYAPPRLSPIPQRSAISPSAASPVPQKISFPPPIDVAAYDEQYSSSNLTGHASSLTSQYQSSSAYQSLTTAGPSAFLPNPNYGSTTSKPTTSISIPGFKPSNFNNNQNTVSVSDPTPASAGSANKNLSQNIGAATSTPKRGRGVLNASVAPGGRIPKCGCCQAQIR